MKKTIWMLLAAVLTLSASLASCSKDNDGPDSGNISKEKIVGTWKTEVKASSTEWARMYLSFAANGTYEGVIVEHHGSQQEVDEADGTWTVRGSYLVMDDEQMLIKSVNANTLVLNYEDEGMLTFTKCDYSELDAARK